MCATSNTSITSLPSIELLIDELRGAVPQPNVSFRPDPNSQVSLGKDIFKGCISNVYLKR